MKPNSNELTPPLHAQRAAVAPTQTIYPTDPDDAAAIVLALVCNPSGRTMPVEAYQLLADRNKALMDAPADQIKTILSRQTVVLEAVMLKYMAAAAAETSPKRAEPLARLALSAQKALIATLGAVHVVSDQNVRRS